MVAVININEQQTWADYAKRTHSIQWGIVFESWGIGTETQRRTAESIAKCRLILLFALVNGAGLRTLKEKSK